jgi:uncharacterized protein (TIGR02118 family)
MIKNLGLIPRRADLTPAQFRDYYETRHAPLALRHIRVFERYVRNHVVDATPAGPPFDCLSEFWYTGAGDLQQVIELLGSPAGDELRADEARFMDRARNAWLQVDERLLFGPARATEDGIVRKQALMMRRARGATAVAFRGAVDRYCAGLLRPRMVGFSRLQLELPVGPEQAEPACDALLTAWTDGAPFAELPADEAIGACTLLVLESIETPPRLLRDHAV